ncbi:MAG: hypothetical protein JXA73_04640 [Acidobacteria bacterium]|nr:hypothetical protein [Acidobacteriota bacterium]
MHRSTGFAFFAFLICAVGQPAFSQLRYNSDYTHDRINTDQTFFVLQDTGTAEYHCASEWTTMTVQSYLNNTVMFVWHFKDGTKAYARQVEYVGDIGNLTEFLTTRQTADLEDARGKKIQPMTRENYPVRVEVWVGEFRDSDGYKPEILIDKACFDGQSIEYGKSYHFAQCK